MSLYQQPPYNYYPYYYQVPVLQPAQPPQQAPYLFYNEKKSKSSTTWTPKEDKLLRDLKEKQKLGWREISTFFSDRTPNACQFRWRRIIASLNAKSKPVARKSIHSINYILN